MDYQEVKGLGPNTHFNQSRREGWVSSPEEISPLSWCIEEIKTGHPTRGRKTGGVAIPEAKGKDLPEYIWEAK